MQLFNRIPNGRQQFTQTLAEPFPPPKFQVQDDLPQAAAVNAEAARLVELGLIRPAVSALWGV